ncbi:DUF397 domain-containing protein [Streptomyces sp. NPDC005133]|uniref:DUF397 domain-containing protein n=1 Tax=Streptomyces sp. NBC_01617 TaxID=2975899 RepID=UPI003863C231
MQGWSGRVKVDGEDISEPRTEHLMQARKAELYALDLTHARWVKSSKTLPYRDTCVEVAELGGGAVAVRDSNHRDLPPLRFTAEEWTAFRDGVREGEFG